MRTARNEHFCPQRFSSTNPIGRRGMAITRSVDESCTNDATKTVILTPHKEWKKGKGKNRNLNVQKKNK